MIDGSCSSFGVWIKGWLAWVEIYIHLDVMDGGRNSVILWLLRMPYHASVEASQILFLPLESAILSIEG